MRLLLTAFGPFPGVPVNPSQMIAEQLGARHRLPELEVVASILPTEYEAAANAVRELISSVEPDAVVCLGTAARRAEIHLERVALNLDDAPIPDNAGRHLLGTAIVIDGPAAYWSSLPLDRIRDALTALEVPVAMSNHAGTYVCNHVFYCARHQLEIMGWRVPCGLIHIPLPLEFAGSEDGAGALPLATLVAAIDACLHVLSEAGIDSPGVSRRSSESSECAEP